jgi:hypothetical protein
MDEVIAHRLRVHYKNVSHGKRIVKGIVDACDDNAPFDDEYFRALMQFHPESSTKHVENVKHFVIRPRPPFSQRVVHCVYGDDSLDDVWYVGCLQHLFGKFNAQRQHEKDVINAFRAEIFSTARWDFYVNSVDDSQKSIGTCARCHVVTKVEVDHHDVPFHDIFKGFLEEHCLDTGAVGAPGTSVGPPLALQLVSKEGVCRIADKHIATTWTHYHDNRACYRLLCKKCNCSLGAQVRKR